ncbi:hypothetical protein CBG01_08300 [Limosilactobacillus reuteri]|uniref:Uncharacterized protein n=1 Tax=Limosilactobacillus reuteri TaxID=1598 RepID=A0A256VEW7_LIMRT|nr:hypothetical protein CBF88_07180 [Limosilactobacillus reuteri]OYS60414.1 hypothetical protein CBF91_07540 [Limosilactobacillus reuteri]OYS63590.1 hypothetical protein CBF89_08065 [Limosilactobacillus reuteri]OYS70737.1 hypothetical protein CBG01_08300 [Limosilactobacillus reuteri]OYS74420.1 hypothetical protein CBG08_07410 [Limosilactobacillus reuteri]
MQEKNYDFIQKAALNPSIKKFIDNSVKKHTNFLILDSDLRLQTRIQLIRHGIEHMVKDEIRYYLMM